MNLSSRTAAGRSRSAEGDLFSLQNVFQPTKSNHSSLQGSSPHAWKRGLQERIWSANGPKGIAARSILALLLWHADANGRVWLGVQAIATKTGAGSLRTVRNALDLLVRQGWLRSTSQTWASLTAEQTAAGRPVPRRGDSGQAPNLYVLLDGAGQSVLSGEKPRDATIPRPGLVRVGSDQQIRPSPGQNDQGAPGMKSKGGPLVHLQDDLDPKGSRSKIVRDEPASGNGPNTPICTSIQKEKSDWVATWNVIVEAHADKTKAVYALPPLAPGVKPRDQKEIADCLDGAALEIHAKLPGRSGLIRDVREIRKELAARVMQLYFKRDNEHLRRVKHALRDLPREFHARMIEAMQAMLRENQEPPKPRSVEVLRTTEKQVMPRLEPGQANTVQEARKLLEALSGGVATR